MNPNRPMKEVMNFLEGLGASLQTMSQMVGRLKEVESNPLSGEEKKQIKAQIESCMKHLHQLRTRLEQSEGYWP
jgi:hypothetical protein